MHVILISGIIMMILKNEMFSIDKKILHILMKVFTRDHLLLLLFDYLFNVSTLIFHSLPSYSKVKIILIEKNSL